MEDLQTKTDDRSLVVKYHETSRLTADKKNPRLHSSKQIKQLARSIESFGFNTPLLVDRNLVVVSGAGRLAAAKLLGLTQVPTICLDHLSPAKRRAFMIADNKLSELSTWDEKILAEHLQELATQEIDFDLEAMGFEVPEFELLVAPTGSTSVTKDDMEEPIAPPTIPISQVGDLWRLGRHLLLCGSALESSSYSRVLEGKQANIIFTDPPFNVSIPGHASGLGSANHSDFVMASGEMTPEQFTDFLMVACRHMATHSKDGAIHFICMDWRHVGELHAAGNSVYSDFKNICVWVKSNAGMGSLYRSQHEFIFVFKNGNASHLNNVQLGRFGRNRTNVWSYPGANMSANGDEEGALLMMHPTVKPVTLVADALMDCSNRKALVLDPFVGSGTTIIAAERTGRCARAIEMDPRYVDVAIRRWERFTRSHAVHAVTGQQFGSTQEQTR